MSLQADQVRNIAHLARLAIADEDVPGYAESLSSILALVEQLDALDTAGVEPMAHPLHATQRLREDAVTEENLREQYQACAPAVGDGLYLVPRVIE